MEYKGYTGSIEYSRHDGCFYGKIEDIADLANYEGRTLEELENSFHEAVDDYIEFCKEVSNTNKARDEISLDDVWQELEVGDEAKSVSAGLLVGELIAAIISARHKQKLSRNDLAQKMNVPVSRIRRMEELKGMPRIDTVIQALLVLGIGVVTPTMMTPEIRVAIEKARVKIVEGGSDDTKDCNFISPDTERRVVRERGENKEELE